MIKYIKVFEARGSEYEEILQKGRGQLQQLQDIVGGYIEVVQLGGGEIAIVNEEGLIHGLPYNPNASMVAGQDLVGDVVIMDYDDLD
jgi:hypothetical protein|tara:strand:+ start:1686 stop:1946 length:261 start_codon:yes stop_codon:yes gene_type:complete